MSGVKSNVAKARGRGGSIREDERAKEIPMPESRDSWGATKFDLDGDELADLAERIAEAVIRRLGKTLGATDEWLTPTQAAESAGVATKTIRAWVNSGALEASRPGSGRSIRIRRSVLIGFLEDRREPTAEVDRLVEKVLRG